MTAMGMGRGPKWVPSFSCCVSPERKFFPKDEATFMTASRFASHSNREHEAVACRRSGDATASARPGEGVPYISAPTIPPSLGPTALAKVSFTSDDEESDDSALL